ncbi:NAD-dependent epimerase/dehydratase family protein [Pseudodesulfovibrio sp.]|nr:NAD-dependent epimerase/dehydratase family protein [Pseudodesulfovibrio sp.]
MGKKQKALVCGSTGFIGRNMATALADCGQYDVYGTHFKRDAIDHPGVTSIHADLTRAKDVDKAVKGMDIIIQAAATTSGAGDIITRPYIHTTDNAVMNSLILRSAYDHSVSQFLFFSCTIMYASSTEPIKESDFSLSDPIPPHYFGAAWTKLYIEQMCEFYARLGKTRFTVMRHSNIYGPHDKYDLERSHVFGATMTKVTTNEDGILNVWGPGTEERDLLHVDDLVGFVKKAIHGQESELEIVNVGLGKAVSIKELVEKIIAHSGKEIVMKHDLSKPHIPTKICLDIDKAKQEYDWHPQISLDEGIKKTMQWYQENVL